MEFLLQICHFVLRIKYRLQQFVSPTLTSILTISPSAIPSPISGNLNWNTPAAGAAGALAAGAADAAGAAGAASELDQNHHRLTTIMSPTRATVPS